MPKFIVKEIQTTITEFEIEAPNARKAINKFSQYKHSKSGDTAYGENGSVDTKLAARLKPKYKSTAELGDGSYESK